MALFKSLFKGINTIVKPLIITPVAKIVSAVAPLLSLAVPSIKLPTETEVVKWIDTKVTKIGEFVNTKVNKIGEWVGDIKIGDKTLGENGFGKFVNEGAKLLDKLITTIITPKVDKFIEDSGKWIADNVVSPIMDKAVNLILDKVVNPIVDRITGSIDTSDITIPNQGIGIAAPTNIIAPTNKDINVTLLTKDTTTKQVSTSDKQSLEKVSEILNNKNDSSFDYQKVAKITDSSSLSSSVKGQFKSNPSYNQYEKMQDLASNQEQVSRYQEIEQQAIQNKILDQQPSEEQVINHQILELQYQ
jgi:hypothetical protein